MAHEDEVQASAQKVADRRAFLKSAGFTGLGLASASIMAGQMGAFDNSPVAKALGIQAPKVHAATDLDPAILNFALNLEYLEAEFYSVATSGKYLEDKGYDLSGTGTAGPTTGGSQVNFTIPGDPALTTQITTIANELAYDEAAHVQFLRSALGKDAVAKPAINLNALGIGFANVAGFLTLARAFEDTGLSAYSGAAPLITNSAYLAAAARILSIEANHSGVLRYLCALTGVSVPKLDKYDVPPPPAGSQYFNVTSTTGLGAVRNTSQVLSIVYGNSAAGTNKGAFFPNGVNGVITTV